MLPFMDTNNASLPHFSRRQFVTTGSALLAGLGLGAMPGQAQTGGQEAKRQATPLFDVPLDSEGNYELPPLPYAYNALEPYIDEQTMRLHHDIHFNGYKNGLNAAAKKLAESRQQGNFSDVAYWENLLAFNGAGYVLHVVFFQNMAPAGSTQRSNWLNQQIEQAFGSFEGMKGQFSAAASSVQGSGWGILGYQPFGRKLVILQAEKHQNFTQWGIIPILALDVWEHAYYLKYQNRRGEYIDNWWNVVNWDNVAARLEAAQKIV